MEFSFKWSRSIRIGIMDVYLLVFVCDWAFMFKSLMLGLDAPCAVLYLDFNLILGSVNLWASVYECNLSLLGLKKKIVIALSHLLVVSRSIFQFPNSSFLKTLNSLPMSFISSSSMQHYFSFPTI